MSLEFDPSNPLRVKRAHDDDDSENEELVDDISNNIKRRKDRGVSAMEYEEDSSADDSSDDEGGVNEDKNDEVENKEVSSDEDMFASDNEEEESQDTKKHKSRSIKTMNMDQFEKENDLDESGEDQGDAYFAHETKHNSDDDDDDDDEEEEDDRPDDYYLDPEKEHYIKPKKGPKMDSFSLKNEKETGVFDESGNYYEAVESDDNEAWQDVKKKEIKKAKLAQEQREKEQKLKNSKRENVDVGQVLGKLIAQLQPVESPMEALARLNKSRVKVKRRGGKKVELTDEQKANEKMTQDYITQLTEYCESLVTNGFNDVYDLEREELMLKYKEETGKAYPREKKETKPVKSQTIIEQDTNEVKDWEFRWVGDAQVNGPYSTREILYWKDNYFNGRAEVRKVGTGTFTHISEATI